MKQDFFETVARVIDSVQRLPDRLSNPTGEAVRSEYARIFGLCIIGHEHKEGGLYLGLPFQVSLLTDPLLYIIGGGLLVVDHPIQRGQDEFAFGKATHVVDLNPRYSLYENRYPRMIVCARRGEKIAPARMLHQLSSLKFHGPFSK
jgi:hypothetical protein